MRKVNEQKRGLSRALCHQHPGVDILKRVKRRLYTVEWTAQMQDKNLLAVCEAVQACDTCLTRLAGELKA
jgi:hypothetical protein